MTGDLESLAQAVQAQVPVKTKAEKNIIRLAQDCQEDSETLLELLSSLKAVGMRKRLWSSLNAAWQTILKKSEVTQLKAQLQESRAEIRVNLTIIIK